MNREEEYLKSKGVAPTAMRCLIYRVMAEAGCALSPKGIEDILETVSLSTITRTLETFSRHHIVHAVANDAGQMLYALCGCDHTCGMVDDSHSALHRDNHAHFICEKCGHIYCIPIEQTIDVPMPEGYNARNVSLTFRGLCPNCNPTKD